MSDKLIAPTFLFRFAAPCLYHDPIWPISGNSLGESYRVPSFGELEDRPLFADLRIAWHETGLTFRLRVTGKSQPPWCRGSRLDESDGLHIWIDTRDTHNIHRATRFCHRFAILPSGGGRSRDSALCEQALINRARENAKPVPERLLQAVSKTRADGYDLAAHIPAGALTGYDTSVHQRLGFTYAVTDRELGWQTFTVSSEFPFQEDPSLWGTLELVRGQTGSDT